jgi:hypothetical protein
MNPFLPDGSPNPDFSGGGFMARSHALMHQVVSHIREEYVKENLYARFKHTSSQGLSNFYIEVEHGAKLPPTPPGKALYVSSSGMVQLADHNGLHTCKVSIRHDCNGNAAERETEW